MKHFLHVVALAVLVFALTAGGLALVLGDEVRFLEWSRPLWFLAVLVPVLALGLRSRVAPRPATMRFSRRNSLARLQGGIAARLAELPDALRVAALLFVGLALAQPQSSRSSDRIEQEGIDIVLALDLSESMTADDLRPSRLEASKAMIDAFVRNRVHDRIAVVAFGSHASTVAPLTTDHTVVRALVRRLSLGVMEGGSTSIGAGLGVALNRLDESDAKSKVVVLLTDGVHNAGGVDPDSVAQEAAERGVHIYTILMGRDVGGGGQNVDPAQLERLAGATGGFAYTAEDADALRTSFQDLLNKLETSVIAGEQVRAELFFYFLWPAFFLLLLDIGLRNTRLRRFP